MRTALRPVVVAVAVLLTVGSATPCSWVEGYFYRVTQLRGTVVGAQIGPLQYVRWLRQSFVRADVTLTLYEYRPRIKSRSELPLVRAIQSDVHGGFDFGALPSGHYSLIAEDKRWGYSDRFDVEVTALPKETTSVIVDISPNFPDCKGGHEFIVNAN